MPPKKVQVNAEAISRARKARKAAAASKKKASVGRKAAAAVASGARTAGGAVASGARTAGGAVASGARTAGGAVASGARTARGAVASGARTARGAVASGARTARGAVASGARTAGGAVYSLTPRLGGRLGNIHASYYKPRTEENRKKLEKKRSENTLATALQKNTTVNSSIKCEMYWFNGLTTLTTASNRGRVQTENYPGIRLKFRSAQEATFRRVLQKLSRTNYLLPFYDPDSWLSKTYEEVKRSVLNRTQVVIAGHSHGGLITTILAEKLNNDPDVPQEKLNNLNVVTFNSIRILPPGAIHRIKKFYQIVNKSDIAQVVSGQLHPVRGVGKAVTPGNNVFWNKPNINFKFNNKTTHSYLDTAQRVLWLWRKKDTGSLTGKAKTTAAHLYYPIIAAAALAGPLGPLSIAAATAATAGLVHVGFESHIDIDLNKFVEAVLKMFKKTIHIETTHLETIEEENELNYNKLRNNMYKMTPQQLTAAHNNAPYGSRLKTMYRTYKNNKGW